MFPDNTDEGQAKKQAGGICKNLILLFFTKNTKFVLFS